MEALKKLFEVYKTDIDHVDNNGQTPIFYAVKFGKIDIIQYLLQNGAQPNRVDNKGTSLMQFAKRHQKQQVMDLLIKYGAKPLQEISTSTKKDKQKAQPAPPKPKQNERMMPSRYQLTFLKEG